jgi:vacuolar-type H+-ATPase subunit H
MSSTQERYIHSLKKIKEAEEKARIEIENHRKKIDEEINNLQDKMEKAITKSKIDGEKLVESSIQQARQKAAIETEKIIKDAKDKAKNITTQANRQTAQEIMNILLKGMD